MKEGRGSGKGAHYIPWLLIHDMPSRDRVTRMKGWKTGRVHHLLSDLERDVFLTYEWVEGKCKLSNPATLWKNTRLELYNRQFTWGDYLEKRDLFLSAESCGENNSSPLVGFCSDFL